MVYKTSGIRDIVHVSRRVVVGDLAHVCQPSTAVALTDDDPIAGLGGQAFGGQHESRADDEPRGDPGQATSGLISGSGGEPRRC